ncbi:MAG TPA: cytochrome c oxidase assembly protein [Terriglobales bacterium]|nr:cytochrome c oxidase assembly protein [Terriglobales bacterium]
MKPVETVKAPAAIKMRFCGRCPLRIALALFLLAAANAPAAEHAIDMRDPVQVIGAYLRATYARDYVEAYRYISSADRKVRDLNRYVRERGAFSGFTLQAAKRLSEFVEVAVLRQSENPPRLQAAIKYRVPDTKQIAPLLLDWDPFRLNSLSPPQRQQLLDGLVRRRRDGSLEMRQGEETFELVQEDGEWRIFLDWAGGVKIPISVDLSKSTDLDVALSNSEFVVQPGDVFDLSLRIRNKSDQVLVARIGHIVAPQDIADYLDFVQCGFLLPVTLRPGKEQEYSGTYMVRGSLPEGVRQLKLTYDFRILK